MSGSQSSEPSESDPFEHQCRLDPIPTEKSTAPRGGRCKGVQPKPLFGLSVDHLLQLGQIARARSDQLLLQDDLQNYVLHLDLLSGGNGTEGADPRNFH